MRAMRPIDSCTECREAWSAVSADPSERLTVPRLSPRRLIAAVPERERVAALLRTETVGGVLLVAAAAVALVLANSGAGDVYAGVRDFRIGPSALHLHLSVQQWTADGLLAIFFFLAGLELKRELLTGQLRQFRQAAIPVAAAVGGMAVPALIYLLVTIGEHGAAAGWAIPTATDIAFALAVLAVISSHLPANLRIFLLTLAVVDDLLAIIIIALFYTRDLHPGYLFLALLPLLGFGIAVQRGFTAWWLLLPLAAATWGLMHASGVHATVAGVLMAFTVPVVNRGRPARPDAPVTDRLAVTDVPRVTDGLAVTDGSVTDGLPVTALAERFEHRLRPLSAGVAVPLFAFFAAGVSLGGFTGLAAALSNRVVLGIVAGMVVGKALGIFGATLLAGRLLGSKNAPGMPLWDLVGLALLGGVGFTVSLLIGDLAFGASGERGRHVQVAVLAGSLIAAGIAAVVLGLRNRIYRNLASGTADP